MKHPLPDMMSAAIEKIHGMADANTIIGDPIQTPEGVMIIPVSKVKYGFAGGGSDFATKGYPANKDNTFGGGTGASVSISPVAFLIVSGGSVKMINVDQTSPFDRLVDMAPDVLEKIISKFDKPKNEVEVEIKEL